MFEKWIALQGFTIDGNKLLHEHTEISSLDYLGLEGDFHMFVLNEIPKEIEEYVERDGMGDDTHVYLAKQVHDTNNQALLWPY